jgi:hypothetical protein
VEHATHLLAFPRGQLKATSPKVAAIKDGNVWGTISLLLSVTTSSIRIAKILV